MSFVGAGGKTSLLLHLARELEAGGLPVLVTTTTHLADPRGEAASPFARVLLRPELEEPLPAAAPLPRPCPGVTLLVARATEEPRKLKGVDPAQVARLAAAWPFVLVEADGARRLPIKAPAAHEPVVPDGTLLTVGVVGLDALGRPMDGETVHRAERFAAVTGCAPGAPIGWEHVVALARDPEGLFRGARGRRAVVLNKSDAAPFRPSPVQAEALGADLVVLSGEGESGRGVAPLGREAAP